MAIFKNAGVDGSAGSVNSLTNDPKPPIEYGRQAYSLTNGTVGNTEVAASVAVGDSLIVVEGGSGYGSGGTFTNQGVGTGNANWQTAVNLFTGQPAEGTVGNMKLTTKVDGGQIVSCVVGTTQTGTYKAGDTVIINAGSPTHKARCMFTNKLP